MNKEKTNLDFLGKGRTIFGKGYWQNVRIFMLTFIDVSQGIR